MCACEEEKESDLSTEIRSVCERARVCVCGGLYIINYLPTYLSIYLSIYHL